MPESAVFKNPILPGFYPDPSICRVGEDFYLVNSSFAYFPGLPIHHSRDLVHWEQIGNAIDRASQLPLEGASVSRGLFAPTIRFNNGIFYIICTNVDNGGNFIVTAKNPEGPWSEPHWLRNAPGIDPSLLFDTDDSTGAMRAWYCGTRPAPEGEAYSGNWEVWLQELDLETLSLKGEARGLWRGALRGAIWPEGPHLYRKGGWYYLTIAEGGTGADHAVSVARSRALEGPWQGNPRNPILTHRHLGRDYAIVNVGHGDLVDDGRGGWWMVHLASRPYGGRFHNMGRETFLVPLSWEDEWPLPCPGSGKVEASFPAPSLPRFDIEPRAACDNFEDPALDSRWLSLRGPASAFSSLSERHGFLRLRGQKGTLRDAGPVSYVGRRQTDMSFSIRAALEFSPAREGEAAGIALFQAEDFHYRLELAISKGARVVRLALVEGPGPERILAERAWAGGRLVLEAEARGQELAFRFGPRPASLELLASALDGRVLSTERAGGFVGATLGMFAVAGSAEGMTAADFDCFEYEPL